MKSNKWVSALKILIFTFILTGVLMMLLALIMYKSSPAASVISGGIIFIYIFSNFIGGFLIGKCMEEKRYLWGLGLGFVYFLILLAISFVVKGGADMETTRIISGFFTCVIGGMIGGMLS